MQADPTDLPTDLIALVGSRICHDLVSPLGAIGNGVELLAMAGAMPGPELALDMLDTDGDGAISAAEFDAMRERMGDRGNGGPMGRPGDNGPGNQRPGGDGHGMQGFWQRWGN